MHDEALTTKAAALFPRIAQFKGFYLVGGTALALHIGHRVSVDFDLFSSQPLPSSLLRNIKKVFSNSKIAITYRTPEQLNLVIDGIKCTFFYFEYPLIIPLIEHKKISLVSIRELAAMKAFAIGKRLSYKDYVDWYFLLKEKHVRLSSIIKLARKKFGGGFQ